jgi:rsbT antagonist protein RsbS
MLRPSECLVVDDGVAVIRVRDVLMVTMHADPSDTAIADLQDKVLVAMERFAAKGVVLDISAVETLDSYFARSVTETTQMIALMGGRTIVAGMQPSVAITATELGLTLGQAATALDVDRALAMLREP